MKSIKRIGLVLLMVCMGIALMPQTVMASRHRDAIRVRKVSLEDRFGEIDVKFSTDVMWSRDAKVVSVRDQKGKNYKGWLIDMDDDDCEIFIRNMKPGRTYQVKISGVKTYWAAVYQTITVKVKVPDNAKSHVLVKKVEYEEDYDDGRMEYTVSFDFDKRVRPKANSYVRITDSHGTEYSSADSFVEWDGDDCEVHLERNLTYGGRYTYEIGPVKAGSKGKYVTLRGSFVARR